MAVTRRRQGRCEVDDLFDLFSLDRVHLPFLIEEWAYGGVWGHPLEVPTGRQRPSKRSQSSRWNIRLQAREGFLSKSN